MAIKTAFGWKDIDTIFMGNIPTFLQDLNYKAAQAKENGYGRGSKPVRRGRGPETFEISGTFGMEECVIIERAIRAKYGPNVKPYQVAPFDVIVTYDNGEDIVADIVKDFEFTEWNRGGAEGDMFFNGAFGGICSDIQFGVPV